jgi:hypothetical protein
VAAAVRCEFCWHRCLLAEGKTGPCGVRRNTGGEVRTLGYGQIVASAVDPIEKKPMYHLLPVRVPSPSPCSDATSPAVSARTTLSAS